MIRLIGDVHGHYPEYLKILQTVDHSIQLGDFGFDYTVLDGVDHEKHRILAGNHDNYDAIGNHPHFLGDFGVHTVGEFSCFFIRGGNSIDKQYRTTRISWWEEEELSYVQMNKCAEAYKEACPDIVISHECPSEITPFAVNNNWGIRPSQTSRMLNGLLTIHQPQRWFFAHLHNSFRSVIGHIAPKTVFHCLDELEHFDIA